MEISAWLRRLDVAQYEPILRENTIDVEILPELTEADLEKLGVVLGHRKRMLRRSPRSTRTQLRGRRTVCREGRATAI